MARGLWVAKKALNVPDADNAEKNWNEAKEYLEKNEILQKRDREESNN